jgi:UDP-sugar transporter A1/2/3
MTFLSAKNVSLLALVLQNAGLVLMIRYSRMRKTLDDDPSEALQSYLPSTVVVSAECLKLVLNLFLELVLVDREEPCRMCTELLNPDTFKLVIPALLYVLQNNLLFVALSNLSVPVYQVTNQGKLLTTALWSRILLNKSISGMQYVSLVILATGVAIVQLSSVEKGEASHNQNGQQSQQLGLMAVTVSCFTSGFAGVYFEMMLKSTRKTSVYMRNTQLAAWSILLGLIPVFVNDLESIKQNGFFQGYDGVVVAVIVCQAMTGLIGVALVMKYADTILKGFATSFAIVLATLLSVVVWNVKVDGWFAVGSTLVIYAVRLYSDYPARSDDSQESVPKADAPSPRNGLKIVFAVMMLLAVIQLATSFSSDFASLPNNEYSLSSLPLTLNKTAFALT